MRRRVTAILAAASLGTAGLTFAPVPAFAGQPHEIAGSHPAWAAPANRVSTTDTAQRVSFRVYLNMRDQAGAEAAARSITTPGTATFHKYLTTDQVRQRYAPAASSVAEVRSWLKGAGFTLGAVPANNLYVPASGTVAQAQRAFGVTLGQYRVRGTTLRGADRNFQIPANLAAIVSSVNGVNGTLNMTKPTHIGNEASRPAAAATAPATGTQPGDVPPGPGFRNSGPCSDFWAQKLDTTDPAYGGGFANPLPYATCGYTPGQLRDAYGISALTAAGIDGRGTTVAIVDAFASPLLYADASHYAQLNDPSHPLQASQFSEIVFPPNPVLEPPDQCDAAGWYTEQVLDVEAVHAMAPGANILYVGGSDCLDDSIDAALNEIVANNRAQIVSNSYGNLGEDIPAAEVQAFTSIVVQAALEGIGIYFSSGDSGDEVINLGFPSADFSASSPWVTAVGGTSVGIDATGHRVVETGWESGRSNLVGGVYTPGPPGRYTSGSGGGTSVLFGEPFYQLGVVPDALAAQNHTGSARGRVVPDISMVGDPNTGMLIGQTQTFPDGVYYDQFRIGGTSLSSPLFAGYAAVADQLVHVRHGFINPALYLIASHTGAIRDVTHTTGAVARVDFVNGVDASNGLRRSVRTFDFTGLTIHTTSGYDNVTGLGTPAGTLLLLLM